jgi:Fur family transcriptional regulator, stress-responsive regulator
MSVRQAVLTWLAAHPQSTAEAIDAGVRDQFGALAFPAVRDGRHCHLICRHCHRMDSVDCVVGEQACLYPVDEHGFAIDEAEVVFWGLCPACTAPTYRQGG